MNMVGSPTPHHMNFSFIPVCTISDEQLFQNAGKNKSPLLYSESSLQQNQSNPSQHLAEVGATEFVGFAKYEFVNNIPPGLLYRLRNR